jgi:hypothetical protein
VPEPCSQEWQRDMYDRLLFDGHAVADETWVRETAALIVAEPDSFVYAAGPDSLVGGSVVLLPGSEFHTRPVTLWHGLQGTREAVFVCENVLRYYVRQRREEERRERQPEDRGTGRDQRDEPAADDEPGEVDGRGVQGVEDLVAAAASRIYQRVFGSGLHDDPLVQPVGDDGAARGGTPGD